MCDAREHLSREVSKEVRRHFPVMFMTWKFPFHRACRSTEFWQTHRYMPRMFPVPGLMSVWRGRLSRKRANSPRSARGLLPQPQMARSPMERISDILPVKPEIQTVAAPVYAAPDAPKILFEYEE